ncbi:MAG: ATPase, T2SS/T4P/T4SS family [Actinomycetota bacterium]
MSAVPAERSIDTPDATSPVDRLLGAVASDPAVTEVLVNGPGPVWVERSGAVEPTGFEVDGHSLQVLIESILGPLGLRVDRASPIVDARLPDGSRVNVVVPPLALGGPVVSIRRFASGVLPLARFGPPGVVAMLAELVATRASTLVVGPTSSGKTSLVAALAAIVDPVERIVCLEDTAELPLARANLVRLEARPANGEGVGEVTLRRLVLTALRMRPDRLIVGEVRGAEAFDLLLALTSGHRGCLTTCHAADVAGGLRRLETLAALAGSGLDADRLRRLVLDGLDAVVVTGRDGPNRHVQEIARVGEHGLTPIWPRGGSATVTALPDGSGPVLAQRRREVA